jgi:hypothetical protein
MACKAGDLATVQLPQIGQPGQKCCPQRRADLGHRAEALVGLGQGFVFGNQVLDLGFNLAQVIL